MEDDPSLGDETGAQACSSAAHADASRIIFFMVRSYEPYGTDQKRHSTSVVWTDQAKRGAEGFKILLEGAVGGPAIRKSNAMKRAALGKSLGADLSTNGYELI